MVAQAVTISYPEVCGSSSCAQSSPPPTDPAQDLCCITTTFQYLETSGWYWGSISASEAHDALLTKSEGTFLVRDSSHPQYMLALSVKTCFGPTSVRIEYSKGSFRLDSILPSLLLQSFPSVVSLVQNYYSSGLSPPGRPANTDSFQPKTNLGLFYPAKDSGVPLKLAHSLHRPDCFPSLQHLTRLVINRHTNCPNQLPLPKPLLHYVQDYPFQI